MQHRVWTARKLAQFHDKTYFLGKSEELVYYLFFSPRDCKRRGLLNWVCYFMILIYLQVLHSYSSCWFFMAPISQSVVTALAQQAPACVQGPQQQTSAGGKNPTWNEKTGHIQCGVSEVERSWQHSLWTPEGRSWFVCYLQLLLKIYGGWAKYWRAEMKIIIEIKIK